LPQKLKSRITGLQGAYIYGGPKRIAIELLNEEDRNEPPALHPLVRIHPETGRKLLYFDPNKLLRIEGLSAAESDALIQELKGYMVQPQAQYRHKWRKGDIVIWDNRCSYHKAAADYPPHEDRLHWRVSIRESAELDARSRRVESVSAAH
jgi:taurine dioxygenase